MTGSRFAAHVRRRRGLWIAGGVLAVLLVPYVTGFVCLRRSCWYSYIVYHPDKGTVYCSHRFHQFAGGPVAAPILHKAFTPIHRWCLGGATVEEFNALTKAQMAEGTQEVYIPYAPNW